MRAKGFSRYRLNFIIEEYGFTDNSAWRMVYRYFCWYLLSEIEYELGLVNNEANMEIYVMVKSMIDMLYNGAGDNGCPRYGWGVLDRVLLNGRLLLNDRLMGYIELKRGGPGKWSDVGVLV